MELQPAGAVEKHENEGGREFERETEGGRERESMAEKTRMGMD